MNQNKIHHGNFLTNNLQDKSQQLIIADPPYYKVKGEFDFIWKTFDDYLKDVEKWAIECKRVLADNGSLLWWGSAKKIAYTQIILDKYFNLINNAVWNKGSFMGLEKSEGLRSLAPCTERILFYGSSEQDLTGLQFINNDQHLYKPIRDYFVDQKEICEYTFKEINEKCFGSASNGGGMASNILTSYKKGWSFPTKEKYEALQLIGICKVKYEELRKEYEELRKEYEELRKEYEELRRTYNNEFELQEVLNFSNEQGKHVKYRHDTKKPEELTRQLILTTSRKGDNIFIPFAGSGTECSMAAKTGRNFEGWDIEKKYVDMGRKRADVYLNQLRLF